MNRTPMLPRNPALPSRGPRTFAAVCSITTVLSSNIDVAPNYGTRPTCVKIHRTAMTGQKRPYRMTKRAELEAATRLRITESAMELHGTVGPARTSVSAVAERAGVRRSTVYRHFPDESALFAACSGHWMTLNPPPDPGLWAAIDDPGERLRSALGELYGFYRRTHPMLANLLRDEDAVPAVKANFAGFRGLLAAAEAALLRGRGERGDARRRVRATIAHAVAFTTWHSLAHEQGLGDDDVAELMGRLVAA